MEMPILGLIIPKKNIAIYNGSTIVLYEIEGYNIAPKFKGFLPRFPRWVVYKIIAFFFHFIRGMGSSIPYRYNQGGSENKIIGKIRGKQQISPLTGKYDSIGIISNIFRNMFYIYKIYNIYISKKIQLKISRGNRGGGLIYPKHQ